MKPFEIALQDYGEHEIIGSVDNQKIVKYFADVGQSLIKDDETAWCSAFAGSCLERAGMKSTRLLNARSYEKWGIETKTPTLGDLVVFWRGDKNGWQGHVGFYINETGNMIRTLGGNQSDQICIAEYPKSQLLSFRKVAGENMVSIPRKLLEELKKYV